MILKMKTLFLNPFFYVRKRPVKNQKARESADLTCITCPTSDPWDPDIYFAPRGERSQKPSQETPENSSPIALAWLLFLSASRRGIPASHPWLYSLFSAEKS